MFSILWHIVEKITCDLYHIALDAAELGLWKNLGTLFVEGSTDPQCPKPVRRHMCRHYYSHFIVWHAKCTHTHTGMHGRSFCRFTAQPPSCHFDSGLQLQLPNVTKTFAMPWCRLAWSCLSLLALHHRLAGSLLILGSPSGSSEQSVPERVGGVKLAN